MREITQKELKKVLDYNPETGFFIWKERISIRIVVGKIAGAKNKGGHITIRIYGKRFYAHRLVWLYIHGKLPKDQIDHINGDCSDNRLINLRESSQEENNRNRIKNRNSKSEYKGITWHKGYGYWDWI